jgi:hypothetical protein
VKKIDLKEDGIIVFFGSMNAMPMMYALELKKMGQDILYFVDSSNKNNKLCRPENHFQNINYPYPEWIIEYVLPSQLLASLFPRLTLKLMLYAGRKYLLRKKIKAVFLGGHFISFSNFFAPNIIKYHLSHGSDLMFWCDSSCLEKLLPSMKKKSIFKYLPWFASFMILKKILQNNSKGASRADATIFFPRGLSKEGDLVIDKLVRQGGRYIPRYDISFDLLSHVDRSQRRKKKISHYFSR